MMKFILEIMEYLCYTGKYYVLTYITINNENDK